MFPAIAGCLFLFSPLYSQIVEIKGRQDLYLKELAPRVWIHVSSIDIPLWGPVSANGLALVSDEQLILIDTPWNDEQTAWLSGCRGRRYSSAAVPSKHCQTECRAIWMMPIWTIGPIRFKT